MCQINRKFISLIIAVCLLLTVVGCKPNDTTLDNDDGSVSNVKSNLSNFDLLYCTKDSFDPYVCKTKQNFELSHLLFDPLVKVDNEFNPVNSLANTVTLKDKTCTIVLKTAYFTDASPVTADDVVFSFNKAKESTAVYSFSLKNAASIVKQNDKTVVITLTKADPYFKNVLDFPILKKDSDQLKNSDNKALPPIGSGRYKFNEDYTTLVINENYHGTVGAIKKIGLIDSPDDEADYHNIEIGAVDYYYSDLYNGSFPKMNGAKAEVNLNNLVFLGINFNARYLSNLSVRQAISAALDRTKIANEAFFTNATAAKGPLPSVFAAANDYQSIPINADQTIATSNLKNADIIDKNASGKFIKNNQTISFNILVNKDNGVRVAAADMIAKQLNEFGFTVKVEKVTRAVYDARIAAKNFDLYLGEIRISNNMDLSDFVSLIETKGYAPAKTDDKNDEKLVPIKTAVNGFYKGEYSLGDMINVFSSELPVIPICHRKGLCMYNDDIKNPFYPSVSDLFYKLENVN